MTAYDIYAAVLRELNQYQAPAFEVGDFNYFFNAERQRFIDDEKKVFELTQQETDNLRAVAKTARKEFGPTGATSRSYPLPEKLAAGDSWEVGRYQHLLGCTTGFVFLEPVGCRKKNDVVFDKVTRMTDDMYGTILDDFYTRPLVNDFICRPYYQVRGNDLHLTFDTPKRPNRSVAVKEIEIRFIAFPNAVKLNSKDKADRLHVDSDWPEDIDMKVVKRTALAFLENHLSQRAATFSQTNPT